MASGFLGEEVPMYPSDYPHSECQFPNSIDSILAWKSLEAQAQRKLFSDNANRFYCQT
jgi:predicted TIM-barrel fold metal-dependent hydrolase